MGMEGPTFIKSFELKMKMLTHIRLALLAFLFLGVSSAGLFAQPVIDSIVGITGKIVRTGDTVTLVGVNLWNPGCSGDRLKIYTNGVTGDTVTYTPGTPFTTGLVYSGTNGAQDQIRFILHKTVACDSNKRVIIGRRTPTCGSAITYSLPRSFVSGERAGAVYPNGGVYCLGDANGTPTQPYNSVLFSVIPPSTGNMAAITDATLGVIPVHSGNLGRYYVRVNTDNTTGHSRCNDTVVVKVAIKGMVQEAMAYSPNPICPVTTGSVSLTSSITLPPGNFESLPSGVAVGPSTGVITPSLSVPGNYQIRYTSGVDSFCLADIYAPLTVSAIDSMGFVYPTGGCKDAGTILPSITHPASGGAFSVLPSMTGFNTTTGAIPLSANAGSYVVTFTPSGGCPKVTNKPFVIYGLVPANFNMSQDSGCKNGVNISLNPVRTGGIFSEPSGSVVFGPGYNVNMTNSTAGGPYNITYILDTLRAPGIVCYDTVVHTLTILPVLTASVHYSDSTLCDNGPINPVPIFTSGSLGGTFSATPSGLSLDNNLGTIFLNPSLPGTYLVTYHLPNNSLCPSSTPVSTVTITPKRSYNVEFLGFPGATSLSVCDTAAIVPLDTIGGNGTVSFEVLGNGMPNGFPGAVVGLNIQASAIPTGGPYPVVYMVSDANCTSRDTIFLTIDPFYHADFNYIDSIACQGGSNPVPHILGQGGGIFTATGTNTLFINNNTGEIDLTTFNAGSYEVSYNTSSLGNNPVCTEIATDSIQLIGINSADIDYDGVRFCTSDADSLVPTGPDPGSGIYTIDPPTGLNINSSGVIFLDSTLPGTYVIEHEIQGGGCVATFTLEITINQGDETTTMAYDSSAYCQSEPNPSPIIVGDQTGIFLGVQGVQFANGSGQINLLNSAPNEVGEYYVISYRLEDSLNGCVKILTDTITIFPLSGSFFEYDPDFMCTTDSLFELGAPPSLQGTFTLLNDQGGQIPNGIDTAGTINVGLLTGGNQVQYEVVFTPLVQECAEGHRQILTLLRGPENADLSPRDSTFCAGQSVTIQVLGENDGAFFYLNDSIPPTWGHHVNYLRFSNWEAGDRVTAIVFTGSMDTIFPVNLPPHPQFYIDFDTSKYDTTWIRRPSGAFGTALCYKAGGLVLDSTQMCLTRLQTSVNVLPKPDLTLESDLGVLSADQVINFEFSSNVDATIVEWEAENIGNATFSPGDGTEGPIALGDPILISNMVSLIAVNSPAQAYYQFRPYANGCAGDLEEITLNINPSDQSVFVPEVFTPQGDGLNDYWHIQVRTGEQPENYTLQLYNNNGAMVLEMTPLVDTWDGGTLPDGVYWWSLIDNRTRKSINKGGLTIRRK